LPESTTWRSAFIGALIAIVLSPLSLVVGYYSSKYLAAPKLSVQYIVPVVDTEHMTFDAKLTSLMPPVQQTLAMSQMQLGAYDPSLQGCNQQFENGSLDLACAIRFRTKLKAAEKTLDYQNDLIEKDRSTIAAWDGKSELVIMPLMFPEAGEPLDELARENPKAAIGKLRDYEKAFSKDHDMIETVTAQLDAFVAATPKRTGNVTFKVGVLNSGDSDGVIFPDAGLSCHVSDLKLQSTISAVQSAFLLSSPSPASPFSVVREHSFSEITLELNSTVSRPQDQQNWASLVKSGTQEEFTIELKTSTSPISRKGILPPIH
jgi:hypothetical protein